MNIGPCMNICKLYRVLQKLGKLLFALDSLNLPPKIFFRKYELSVLKSKFSQPDSRLFILFIYTSISKDNKLEWTWDFYKSVLNFTIYASTTKYDLISKMHENSRALTLFSDLFQCRGPPKLPKTSLTHETEWQTDAGGATITSYIVVLSNALKKNFVFLCYNKAF